MTLKTPSREAARTLYGNDNKIEFRAELRDTTDNYYLVYITAQCKSALIPKQHFWYLVFYEERECEDETKLRFNKGIQKTMIESIAYDHRKHCFPSYFDTRLQIEIALRRLIMDVIGYKAKASRQPRAQPAKLLPFLKSL